MFKRDKIGTGLCSPPFFFYRPAARFRLLLGRATPQRCGTPPFVRSNIVVAVISEILLGCLRRHARCCEQSQPSVHHRWCVLTLVCFLLIAVLPSPVQAQSTATPQISLSAASLTVTEGGSVNYTVALATQPTETVTVAITGLSGTDVKINNTSLTFTRTDWSMAQTVTVKAEEDDDGVNDPVSLTHTASGGDYDAVTAVLAVTIDDNDEPALRLSLPSLTIQEAREGRYTVVLATEPTAEVTVTITETTGRFTIPSPLTFTPSNWSSPQTVTLRPQRDVNLLDETVTVVHTASGSEYTGKSANISVTVTDNDAPALRMSTLVLAAGEGRSTTYTVWLSHEPSAMVTVDIMGHSETDLTLDNTSLTFTASDWRMPQTVTISAAEDDDEDDDTVELVHSASGGGFSSVMNRTVTVTVTDNEGFRIILAELGSTFIQESNSRDYLVALNREPSTTVTVTITGGDDLMLDKRILTFTSQNWSMAQTVKITVPAEINDVHRAQRTLIHTASGGDFGSVTASLEFQISQNTRLVLKNATPYRFEGTEFSYSLSLAGRPPQAVTVTISNPTSSYVTTDVTSLTFTQSNWDMPQMVTVTIGEDDNAINEWVIIGHYGPPGFPTTSQLGLWVADNDPPGVRLSAQTLDVLEGDRGSYTVWLATEPEMPVTVAITGYSGSDLSLDKKSLTFTALNWNMPQTVMVDANEDDDEFNDKETLVHTTSGSREYPALTASLGVTVTDNEVAGLLISPPALTVAEGGSGSYSVRLVTEPAAMVTVAITGHEGTDLKLDKSALKFTRTNWNSPQRITVSAEEDADRTNDMETLLHSASGGDYPSVTGSVPVTVDDNDWTVEIGGVPDRINLTTAFTATFTFSEDVTGFETGDVTVTGGRKGAFSGSGNEYTLVVTPSGSANVVVTVMDNSATDGLNTGPASDVSATAIWDVSAPTVEITGVPAKINSVAEITATFTFSEAVTEFVSGDVTVSGGTKSTFTGSGNEYTLAITPNGSANMVVMVTANSVTDGVNTGPATAVSASAVWDASAPTVKITGVPAKINSMAQFTATFTFSEAVTGFVSGDVTVSDGTKDTFTEVSATTYTLEVTPDGSEDVVVTVTDNSATDGLNTGPTSAVSATATWDASAPTVKITGVPAKINSMAQFTATFTFSEAVTEFVTGDVTVDGGTKGIFSGSGTTYTLAVTPSGLTDVVVTVEANSATDGLNTGPTSAVSKTAVWDADAPTVEITGVPRKINSTAQFTVTFTFSEAVTEFVSGDVTVSGGTKGTFDAVNATTYTLVVNPTNGSNVTVEVAAEAATDGTNPGPASAVSATAVWDASAPTVEITGVPRKINSTAQITATFTFSEAVTGFQTEDVTVNGGTKGAFSGSGNEYTLVVMPSSSADVVVTVAANSATDGLNTGPTPGVRKTAVWDASAPTVKITGVPAKINSMAQFTATFTFSEAVMEFVTGDVTVSDGTKGTFTEVSATTYTLAVMPSGSTDVVVTVTNNSATDGLNTGPASAVSTTAIWDADAPTVTIGGVPARINSTAELSVTFRFSEAVTGFATEDVTVSGGLKGTFSGSGSTYTLGVTPANRSNVTVEVAAKSATDGVNVGPASEVSKTAVWDADAPTVEITGMPAKINSTVQFTATFKFSETVAGFGTEDVTVTGGLKGTFSGSGATYTLAIMPSGSADVVVTVTDNSATDGINTGPTSAVSKTTIWDADAPTVTIGGVPARINSTTRLNVTFTFSEAVTGFNTEDVTVNGGTKGTFSGSGLTYTLAVTPSGAGDVMVEVTDNSATDGINTGPTSAVSKTAIWDAEAPAVKISGVPARINSIAELNVTFTFSETVTGFNTGDIIVTGGTKGTFTGSGTIYTLAVTPSGSADVVVTVTANSATDANTNPGPASDESATAIWDADAPTVEIGGVPTRINSTAELSVTFTFSEAVTGFETGDVTLTGGSKGTFSGSGSTYTLAVTPANGSNVTVEVATNSATDGLNTGPNSAVSKTAVWDAGAPTVVISGVPDKINSTAQFTATFTFSEAVTGFNTEDVTVNGGAKGAFSGSGTTYTVAVTPSGATNVVITVAAGSATDGVNTGPTLAVSKTAVWDADPPTVVISGVPGKIASTAQFTATFTFSEVVTEFITGDVTVTGGSKDVFSGSGSTYTLVVTPFNGSNVTVEVAAKSATDGLNTGPISAVSATAAWDANAPAVEIGGVPVRINSTAALSVTFTFTEAVTGFNTEDVTVNGGTKGAFASVSATTYTLVVTPLGSADVVVTVAANSATDGLNTAPDSPVSRTAIWDATAPAVAITGVPAKISSTAQFTVTFTFTEAVTGFQTGDVTVTGGSKGIFSGGGATYTLAVTPSGSANVVVTVTANSATDGLNTGPAAAVSATAIWDAAAPKMVSLSVTPNPVDEGQSATVTARLSRALPNGVTIPLTLTAGTAESGDYGALTGIAVAAGSTTGTGTVATVEDADRDDETFTVALGALPDGLMPGDPSSVGVTIRDRTPPPNRPPTVTVSCDPCVVSPGGSSLLTATASDTDGDPLSYAWSAPKGNFTGPADEPVARWTAPAELGTMAIRVEVTDGRGGSASATVEVKAVNRPPEFGQPAYDFELPEKVSGRESPAVLGPVTASDLDGDAVTYEFATGDQNRFAVGVRDGVVRYVGPGEDFETEPNRFELTVRVSDEFGGEARTEVAVVVTDVNEAPEATDDEISTLEDQVVDVHVLTNDTDPEGDRLRVQSVTAAAHGAVRLASSGIVIYTPEADFNGTDSFTYIASDGDGLTDMATVEVTVLPVNDAPATVGTIPDQTLDEGGDPVHVDVSPYFGDVEEDALTYGAQSSDTGVVQISMTDEVLVLVPVVYGSATITVTAWDPAGLSATQSVRVGVSDRPQRAILANVLAATARSHLASIRVALGRRMETNPCEASHLAVMGRSVPLDRTEAAAMIGQIGTGAHSAAAAALGLGKGAGGMRPLVEPGSSAAGTALETELLSVPARALLGDMSGEGAADFLLGWSKSESKEGSQCPGRGRWSLWGQGDVQRFEGTPSSHAHDSAHDGKLLTAYVGLDTKLGKRWLAGVALSRSEGVGDWRVGTSEGQLTQYMTAVYPYLRWTGRSTSVWASVGAGRGDARNVRATRMRGTSPTDLWIGLVALEQNLGTRAGLTVTLVGDAAWASLRTGEGVETIDGQNVAVDQIRAGADLSLPVRLGSAELTPSGTVHLRRDGGAGQTGVGIEVGGGLRAILGIVRLDAQARMLAHHSAEGYRERGAAVTLVLGRRDGFSLSVSPRWGDSARASGALLRGPLGGGMHHGGPGADRWTLDARASYTVRLSGGLSLDMQGSYSGVSGGPGFGLSIGRSATATTKPKR